MPAPWENYQTEPSGPWRNYATSEGAGTQAKVLSQPTRREAEDVSMAALEANPPEYERPSRLAEVSGGYVSRPAFTMAGGGIGAALAAPGGPPAIAAGGALGAAAGSLLFDVGEYATRLAMGRPVRTTDPFEPAARALREGAEDIAFAAGIPAAGRAGKRLVGKALKLRTPAARTLTALAEAKGIDIGAAHVSPRKLVRGLPKALGVFPFVGTPLREGQARIVGQLDDAAADMLNTLAPTKTAFDLGKKMTEAAAKKYATFNRIASALYKRFHDTADTLSVREIVDSAPIKDELAKVESRASREAITLQTGEPLERFGADRVGDYLKQLAELPERITVEQARGLERELNAIVRNAAREGYDVSRLTGMKGALEEAKATLDVSRLTPGEAERILKAWSRANRFYAQTKGVFETAAASRFGRVDRNIFGRKFFKAGALNEDEAVDLFMKMKSPEALKDTRRLIGNQAFAGATRKALERAYRNSVIPAKEGALTGDMFSAAKFEKTLGLDTAEGREMLTVMLEGSKVKPRDWYEFLEVAKAATDITIRDPSTFVTRRLILGGGLAGSVAMGAGHISLPAAALLTLFTRKGAAFLMNKDQLRAMTRFLDPSTSELIRKGMIYRLLKAPFKDRG